jgi:hypothetical protein
MFCEIDLTFLKAKSLPVMKYSPFPIQFFANRIPNAVNDAKERSLMTGFS